MKTRSAWIIVSSLLLFACGDSEQSSSEATLRPVQTTTVSLPDSGIWREFPGVVDATQKADLSFRVAGKLTKLLINEGDTVEQDQVLAQLDQTDFKIQYNSKQAEYLQADADYKRAENLVKAGHISRSEYDKLSAQRSSAKASMDAARQNLEYTTLHAPFAGHIAKRYVQNHEDVSPGQPIFTLQDTNTLSVKIDVPESIMIRIKKNVERRASASFDAIPGKQFPLTFKEVATQADEQSKTFRVTFTMQPVEGYNILPGMSATVRGEKISSNPSDKISVFLPAHAVLEDKDGRYVYAVTDINNMTGTIQRRNVTTNQLSSQGLEITSGLTAGDQVVTAGMSKMQQGLQVRLMNTPENGQ